MKKIILLFALIFAFIISGCSKNIYNNNPDLASKVVGSKSYAADKLPVNSIDDLLKDANLIIVGEVISYGQRETFNIYGSREDAAALIKSGINPYIPSTLIKVKVIKVIEGKIDTDEITLFELGHPDKDDWQTKVKLGETLVMILKKFEGKDTYCATNAEDSMFYLDENDKLLSMSDEKICARYDGIKLSVLTNDIKNAKTKVTEAAPKNGIDEEKAIRIANQYVEYERGKIDLTKAIEITKLNDYLPNKIVW